MVTRRHRRPLRVEQLLKAVVTVLRLGARLEDLLRLCARPQASRELVKLAHPVDGLLAVVLVNAMVAHGLACALVVDGAARVAQGAAVDPGDLAPLEGVAVDRGVVWLDVEVVDVGVSVGSNVGGGGGVERGDIVQLVVVGRGGVGVDIALGWVWPVQVEVELHVEIVEDVILVHMVD